jgi:predicted ATP-grasp superfamily ATP-dependent carboligase
MNKKILILDAGEAPYPLVVARSLGSIGYHVYLGFSYGSRIFSAYSKYCKGIIFYPDPSYAQEDFLSFFEKLAGRYDYIMPAMEKTELSISMIKDILEEKGTCIPIPSHDILIKAVNKAKLLEICAQNGINIPKTLVLAEPPKVDEVVEKVGIPFVMKASTEIDIPTGPGSRYFVFRNNPLQEQFLLRFARLQNYGAVILQQWIEGIGVGASFVFSKSHEPIAYFGHRRILERFLTGGPSVIAEAYGYLNALKQGIRLLKLLKWEGVAMTEFRLGYDEELYFMELNPRFWGTLSLAIASGLDFPRLLIEHYDSEQKNDLFNFTCKKKIFVKSLTIPYLLFESVKMKNLNFSKKIIRSSFKIFKYGFPYVEEFGKFDLVPIIKQLIYGFRNRFSKGRFSKVNGILFGPVMSYKKLGKLGIKSIIDLREDSEKTLLNKSNNFEYYDFPIKDDSAPDPNSFLMLTSMIDRLVKKGPIYIHCRLGRGRASMAVIAFLIYKGTSIGKAYSIVYEARPFSYLNNVQKRAIYEFYKKFLAKYIKN